MSLHDALQAAARWPLMVDDIRMWGSWDDPSCFIETLDRLQNQCREFSGFINENEELLTRIAPCEVEVNDWVYPHASAASAALAWWIQRSLWSVVDHRSYWDAIEGDQSKRFDPEMIRQPDKLEACRKEIDRIFSGGWWGTKVYSGIAAKVTIELQHYVTNVGDQGSEKVQSAESVPLPAVEKATPGYLDLIVDEDAKKVQRTGFDKVVIFHDQATAIWPMFQDAFKAKGESIGDTWRRVDGKRQATNKQNLNKELLPLDVMVNKNWQLVNSRTPSK